MIQIHMMPKGTVHYVAVPQPNAGKRGRYDVIKITTGGIRRTKIIGRELPKADIIALVVTDKRKKRWKATNP